jgi:Carboxypeptidase regulatory-like domain
MGSLINSVSLVAALILFAGHARAAPQIADTPQTISGGAFRIAGIVVSKVDSHPLARARITVRDTKDPQRLQSVITAEDGRFEFTRLPAGKYSVTGAKHGFISGSYDQHDQFSTAIVTGAGLDTETLVLRLSPDAAITGKVLDEVGDPVRHASVQLYYDDHSSGVDEIRQSRGAQTDDQGVYEITPLRPGTYVLSANATPWYAVHPRSEPVHSKPALEAADSEPPNSEPTNSEPDQPAPSVDRSLDVAYPVTYYPDVTDTDSATPIPIRGGERVQVDIHLNPVPAIHLFFHVQGNGRNGYTFPQLEQTAFDGSTFVRNGGGMMISPGVVEITGIPAGHYNVRFSGSGQNGQISGIDLTKDGEEIDASASESTSTVKVSVKVQDEATLPSGLMVGLRSGRRVTGWQSLDPKGEAEFAQVAAGRYEVVVQGSGKRYSIVHMSGNAADVGDHTLTVAAGSSPSIALTLVSGSVVLQGTVKHEGKPFAGAMIVLVPKNPEMNRDLFRRDQSDLDGTFTLRSVLPGSYTIVAIDNGWDLDWAQPNVIEAYLKHGRAVQIGSQPDRHMDIGKPIELQSR